MMKTPFAQSLGRPHATTTARERARYRILGCAFTCVLALWILLCLYVVHPALAYNPVALPFEKEISARLWSPQGWKFFTRNPREDVTLLFARTTDGHWDSISKGPNFRAANLFGVSREARAQGIELGLLVYDVPRNKWQACEEEPANCLERMSAGVKLLNRSPIPSLCGVVGVALQGVVPWAWAGAQARLTMPSKVLRLEVQC